jgi:prepilin-type N-terminal cleavage/methylation domain-containing protein
MQSGHLKSGFTIVELLIVIVVIAILAAITIVAFNGVQNRASDAAVSSDLANILKKFEQQRVEEGATAYPVASGVSFVVPVNKSQYSTASPLAFNLLVCYPTLTAPTQLVVLATSKSGKKFTITTGGGVKEYTGGGSWAGTDPNPICATVQPGWIGSGAGWRSGDTVNGPWRAWVGGN